MMKKSIVKKSFSAFLALIFLFAYGMPIKAFYIEVPASLKENTNVKKTRTLLAQEDSSMNFQPNNQPPFIQQTCNVNGVEMPGPCTNYNNKPPQNFGPTPDNQFRPMPDNTSGGQPFGPNMEEMNKQDEERRIKDQERQKQDQERQMKDMQNGTRQMERNLNRLESMFKKAEKDKIEVPQEVKDKLNQAKKMMETMKSAKSFEEMQNVDMGELSDITNELDRAREEVIDQAQRLQQFKRGIKDMTRGLTMFESQIKKLSKQKIGVPEEITEQIKKIRTVIDTINKAKTWDEAEEAGIEDLQELMQSLDEYRGQLEMLARWPQTLKEIDRELKRITQELKKSKTIVAKLSKKGLDLSAIYSEFESSVNKLKAAKDEAAQQVKTGNYEDVFDTLENNFFGQLQDMWQYPRIIQTMSNLGRFQSEFKKQLAQAQREMNKLKKKKIDTQELEELIVYMNLKGKEIAELLKEKSPDPDEILDKLQELESLGQEFEDKMMELTGGDTGEMPWEKGPRQFETPKLPDTWARIMPQKTQEPKENLPSNETQPKAPENNGESINLQPSPSVEAPSPSTEVRQ